jgi:hypothetical protein
LEKKKDYLYFLEKGKVEKIIINYYLFLFLGKHIMRNRFYEFLKKHFPNPNK